MSPGTEGDLGGELEVVGACLGSEGGDGVGSGVTDGFSGTCFPFEFDILFCADRPFVGPKHV